MPCRGGPCALPGARKGLPDKCAASLTAHCSKAQPSSLRHSVTAPRRAQGPPLQKTQGEAVPPAHCGRGNMAERVGFEPTDRVNGQRFSRPPHSTTLAPLRLKELYSPVLTHSPRRSRRRGRGQAPPLQGFTAGRAGELAEREGFEPSVEFPQHTLSRRAPSAARSPLRNLVLLKEPGWLSAHLALRLTDSGEE